MWYLIYENNVVGVVPDQEKVFGAVLNYIRTTFNATPCIIGDFSKISSPEGVYLNRKDDVYTVRKYSTSEGYLYNVQYYSEFTIHLSFHDGQKKSALKPSFLDALKGEKPLLKPVLKKN
jgi:hypothetical protein